MTYLTIKCDKGHLYRAYHVDPDHKNVMYCMYCGTQHVSVEVQPEWDVIDLLAREYNCTTDKVRKALSVWQQEVKLMVMDNRRVLEAHPNTPLHSLPQPLSFREFMTGTPL